MHAPRLPLPTGGRADAAFRGYSTASPARFGSLTLSNLSSDAMAVDELKSYNAPRARSGLVQPSRVRVTPSCVVCVGPLFSFGVLSVPFWPSPPSSLFLSPAAPPSHSLPFPSFVLKIHIQI